MSYGSLGQTPVIGPKLNIAGLGPLAKTILGVKSKAIFSGRLIFFLSLSVCDGFKGSCLLQAAQHLGMFLRTEKKFSPQHNGEAEFVMDDRAWVACFPPFFTGIYCDQMIGEGQDRKKAGGERMQAKMERG